jgi:hypothetical protein
VCHVPSLLATSPQVKVTASILAFWRIIEVMPRSSRKAKPRAGGFPRWAGLACLIALGAFQAPVVAGMVIATGACCIGDHCPIASHHHSHSAAKEKETPIGCGHNMNQGADKVEHCSVSCCKTDEQSAVHSNVFLLSPIVVLASANPLSEAISIFEAGETLAAFAPLSPPPKFLHSLI